MRTHVDLCSGIGGFALGFEGRAEPTRNVLRHRSVVSQINPQALA